MLDLAIGIDSPSLSGSASNRVQPRIVRSFGLVNRLDDPAGERQCVSQLLTPPEHEPPRYDTTWHYY